MLLAIDTASNTMSLALFDGSQILAEQTWRTQNRHTAELPPAVSHMLKTCGLTVDALTRLGVSTGPGSYTGVRIGVAFTKGLAAPKKLPVVGVTTLDTLAAGQPHYQSGAGLVAVVQAGRGRIIVKAYRWRKGEWEGRTDPQLIGWEALLDLVDGPACITGEIDAKGADFIRQHQAEKFPLTLAPPVYRLRRAGFLAQVAWSNLDAVEDTSTYAAEKILPVYVKTEQDA